MTRQVPTPADELVVDPAQALHQLCAAVSAVCPGSVATATALVGGEAYQARSGGSALAQLAASVPFAIGGQQFGRLDLYRPAVGGWTATQLATARTVAAMTTSLLALAEELASQRRTAEQLQEALNSRVVIEQAKGVLAARLRISVERAFEVLRKHARDHNLPLHAVARAVVDARAEPPGRDVRSQPNRPSRAVSH